MVDYWDRLEAALTHSGKTLKDLQLHLKVSYQAMKKVSDGKTKALTAENNANAAQFLGIDSDWLATGKGQMNGLAAQPYSEVQSRAAHVAHDTSKHHLLAPQQTAPPWPFTTVSHADYSNLSDLQKGLIEGYAKRLVEESTHDKSLGDQKAA